MFAVLMRRLAAVPLVLLLASLFVFSLPTLTGVDLARATLRARIAESEPDPQTLPNIRKELALDQPFAAQYGAFLKQLAVGDFGYSYSSRQPVGPTVFKALSISASIAALSMGIAVLCAVPLGLLAAARRGSLFDRILTMLNRTMIAIPIHVMAPIIIMVVSVQLRWLPTGGWTSPKHMILPVVSMALVPLARAVRI